MSIVRDDLRQDYRGVAVERAKRFLAARKREAKSWPDQQAGPNAVDLLRLTVEPSCDFLCGCFFLCESSCLRGAWLRCMEAAGLPGRPYTGERAHLDYMAQERAAEAERDRLERRRLELVARLVAPYPDREVWQAHWVNVPSKQVAAFWDAEREGTAEAWLDARDAALIRLDESAEAGGVK